MKALVINGPRDATVVERPIPAPGPGDVRLRVAIVGFCGSDLSTFRGVNPLVRYPRIPGHEISGTIDAVGTDVPGDWRPGARALVIPYTACGACSACRRDRFNCCRNNETLGVQRDGAMAEFIVVPYQKLLTHDGLTAVALAMVEPLTVGFHAVARGCVETADRVLVFGCGMIGLGAIAAAARRGAKVVAVDIDGAKLARARACGAATGINAAETKVEEAVAALTNGEGADVTIEAAGQPATFRAAVANAAFAGRVVYIGYTKAPVEYNTQLFVQRELDIRGSRNATPADFHAVVAMLSRGAFPLDTLISRRVSLADAPAALAEWDRDPAAITKILVEL